MDSMEVSRQMAESLGVLQARVLVALVESYNARAGLKPRLRSLSEHEIARRLGIRAYGYSEFGQSPERAELTSVLQQLSALGLVVEEEGAGRYSRFLPTSRGIALARQLEGEGPQPEPRASPLAPPPSELEMLQRISTQLDRIAGLLEAIYQRISSRQ